MDLLALADAILAARLGSGARDEHTSALLDASEQAPGAMAQCGNTPRGRLGWRRLQAFQ
jgi:hypothetical protein